MKQVIVFILALMLITSCDKGLTVYQMRILIKNDTDSSLKVTLYPKSKYVRYGMYSYSDMHSKYKDTTFIPDTKLGTEMFSTDTLDMDPTVLINRVFDSIKIKYSSGRTLKFSTVGAVSIPNNPFSEKSAWIYQKNILEHVRTWRDNNVESEDYTFTIER